MSAADLPESDFWLVHFRVLGEQRCVRAWDDVSEFTRSATTLRTGFLTMHAGKQRCSAAHNRMIKDAIANIARDREVLHFLSCIAHFLGQLSGLPTTRPSGLRDRRFTGVTRSGRQTSHNVTSAQSSGRRTRRSAVAQDCLRDGFPNIYCYGTRLDSNEKSSQYSPPFSKVTGSTASLVNLEMARAQKWQAGTFDCITRISHSPGSLFHSSCVT